VDCSWNKLEEVPWTKIRTRRERLCTPRLPPVGDACPARIQGAAASAGRRRFLHGAHHSGPHRNVCFLAPGSLHALMALGFSALDWHTSGL
jgi:hypothetical protein